MNEYKDENKIVVEHRVSFQSDAWTVRLVRILTVGVIVFAVALIIFGFVQAFVL